MCGEGEEDYERIERTTVHMITKPEDPNENSYAHPVEGLHVIFDLTTFEVVRIDDFGVIPVPKLQGDYASGTVPTRSLNPLEISQPDGPSFVVDGHHLTLHNCSLPLA